jgi:hypothetical protein
MTEEKPEFPPLLPPGLRHMTREELRPICVDAFPDSLVRRRILESLFFVLDRLADGGITGEAWIDGSFLTTKPNPADVDVVFRIPGEQFDHGTAQQREAIDWVSKNLKDALLCDTFVFFVRTEDHPLYAAYQIRQDYWLRQFGTDRAKQPKGIAVISLEE